MKKLIIIMTAILIGLSVSSQASDMWTYVERDWKKYGELCSQKTISYRQGHDTTPFKVKSVFNDKWTVKYQYCGFQTIEDEIKSTLEDYKHLPASKQIIESHLIQETFYGIKYRNGLGPFARLEYVSYTIRKTTNTNDHELWPDLCNENGDSNLVGHECNKSRWSISSMGSFDDFKQIFWKFEPATENKPASICDSRSMWVNQQLLNSILDQAHQCVYFPASINDDPVQAMKMLIQYRPVHLLGVYN
jgi:hypothetical protein